MNRRAAETIEAIDELLEGGELDDDTVDDLIELLRPGESAPWPALEAVLHVAEHRVVASDLRMHAVPDRLEQAIGEALEAVLPLLGIRPYGPTYKIAEIARRHLEAESEKFERVAERVEQVDSDRGCAILGRYFETEPAPMFVHRMRSVFPELVERAADWEPAGLEEAVDDPEELATRLRDPEGLAEVGPEGVRAALERLDQPSTCATRALASEDWHHQLIGAAMAALSGLDDLAAACLRCVSEGSEVAPELAVIAAHLAPEQTRHASSTFLAEVSWQNPELPEAELDEARIRAILSARSILPRVGSPMEELDVDDVPEFVESAELREIPERLDVYWEAWRAVWEYESS